jgi:hypothetical protein
MVFIEGSVTAVDIVAPAVPGVVVVVVGCSCSSSHWWPPAVRT